LENWGDIFKGARREEKSEKRGEEEKQRSSRSKPKKGRMQSSRFSRTNAPVECEPAMWPMWKAPMKAPLGYEEAREYFQMGREIRNAWIWNRVKRAVKLSRGEGR